MISHKATIFNESIHSRCISWRPLLHEISGQSVKVYTTALRKGKRNTYIFENFQLISNVDILGVESKH